MAVAGDTAGIVAEVMSKLESISARVGKDVVVVSGKRDGDVDESAHNSGIAADIRIDGMTTVGVADEMLTEGFSAIGEYYDTQGTAFFFAHGDIRGLPGSENSGAYAPGGSKAGTKCWYREGTATSGTYHYGSRKSGHACPT